MAYDSSRPADDETLSVFPAGARENARSLKEDQIVNAGTLKGLSPNNNSGQIPISNGTVNTNLNADMVDGKNASDFATSGHTHSVATTSSAGFESAADKTKLETIATGAEVNQNAFSNITVGSTTIQADAKQDTLILTAGTNIALTPDATNDKVIIGVTGTVDASASCTGNSATATTLATARTIGISGGATGTATSFNGSANITIPVTSLDATKLSGTATISTTGNAATATKATGDKNGVDITNYLRSDVSITPSQAKTAAASGIPADLLAMLLTKIKGIQGTTNFQDDIPATLTTLAGYFDSSGNALTAVKGKSTPTAGDNSTLIATTAFVASALSSAGYISTPIDSYDVSNASAWWIKLKGAPGIIIQGISMSLNNVHGKQSFPISFSTSVLIAPLIIYYNTYTLTQKITGYNTSSFSWESSTYPATMIVLALGY